MNINLFKKSIIILVICLIIPSCSTIPSKAEEELVGKWEFTTSNNGNEFFAFDLEFTEDGKIIIPNNKKLSEGSVSYKLVSSEELKISIENISNILNFYNRNNTLKIFFEDGYNEYTRKILPNVGLSQEDNETKDTNKNYSPTQIDHNQEQIISSFKNRKVITSSNAKQLVNIDRWGKGRISEIVYSPDGNLLAAATSIGIYLYSVTGLEQIRLIETDSRVHSVAFSPDGETIVSGGNSLQLWDVTKGTQLKVFADDIVTTSSVSFSPDGKIIISGGGTVRLWERKHWFGKYRRTFTHFCPYLGSKLQ